jgi:uncharacterized protein (UPF0332 family)
MDEATRRAYINIRLEKASDDLVTARDNLTLGHWRVAVNRAYYAIFHVASATLSWSGVERARHAGIQSAFSEFLIKPGIIEPEYSKIFAKAQKIREEQDYDLEAASLTAEDTEQIIADAERFVARLERYLHEVGAIK